MRAPASLRGSTIRDELFRRRTRGLPSFLASWKTYAEKVGSSVFTRVCSRVVSGILLEKVGSSVFTQVCSRVASGILLEKVGSSVFTRVCSRVVSRPEVQTEHGESSNA